MNSKNSERLIYLLSKYDILSNYKSIGYGTAGYRMKATIINGFVFRMAVLGILRSSYMKKCIGLMITASHNLEQDNGVKIVDPNGDMLVRDWETLAAQLISLDNIDFIDFLNKKCKEFQIDINSLEQSKILIGYDTRKSSPILSKIIDEALDLFGCSYLIFEHFTTPQLHYFVKTFNNSESILTKSLLIERYFHRFSQAFIANKPISNTNNVFVDCANGVGAIQLQTMAEKIAQHLQINLFNTNINENLNNQCGADYVKINQACPLLYNTTHQIQSGEKWCSLDGDADRLVYFYITSIDNKHSFHLLDGDKCAVLIADYLAPLLKKLANQFTVGIVQTAYANAAATQHIESNLDIEVQCVPTGVKYLHEAAKEYDVGIYFEANGHGTILFSDKFRKFTNELPLSNELRRIVELVNDADGDAICDLLLIEHILMCLGWSLEQWDQLYVDYPSRQLKVTVCDRTLLQTIDAERKVKNPIELQKAIDDLVVLHHSQGKHARAFVRPSGTEDIVRVYAESTTQSDTDELANSIAECVRQIVG